MNGLFARSINPPPPHVFQATIARYHSSLEFWEDAALHLGHLGDMRGRHEAAKEAMEMILKLGGHPSPRLQWTCGRDFLTLVRRQERRRRTLRPPLNGNGLGASPRPPRDLQTVATESVRSSNG